MRGARFLVVLFFIAATAAGQDVLTVGAGSAPAGGTVQIPVSIRDRSGTTLGGDAGAGRRISGFSFKVLYAPSQIASMSFARAGVALAPTPLFETSFAGSGYASGIALFTESNPMNLTLDAAAPGNVVGTLTVTLQASVTNGTVIPLTIDAPSAMLSSQSGADRETIALGNLALVHGSITVNALAVPTNLTATANGTSQVTVTWTGVAGSDHYEVWRSSNGGAFASIATPSGVSHIDLNVAAGVTYLYRVRAVSAAAETSGFSNTDAATTILFTDAVPTVIRLVHFTELRAAVNAMRAAAALPPLAADGTLGIGLVVRASHVNALRTGLDQARAVIGQPALAYTDATLTSGVTVIKSAHVLELRNGVR